MHFCFNEVSVAVTTLEYLPFALVSTCHFGSSRCDAFPLHAKGPPAPVPPGLCWEALDFGRWASSSPISRISLTSLKCHVRKPVVFWNDWTRYPHAEVSDADVHGPRALLGRGSVARGAPPGCLGLQMQTINTQSSKTEQLTKGSWPWKGHKLKLKFLSGVLFILNIRFLWLKKKCNQL